MESARRKEKWRTSWLRDVRDVGIVVRVIHLRVDGFRLDFSAENTYARWALGIGGVNVATISGCRDSQVLPGGAYDSDGESRASPFENLMAMF